MRELLEDFQYQKEAKTKLQIIGSPPSFISRESEEVSGNTRGKCGETLVISIWGNECEIVIGAHKDSEMMLQGLFLNWNRDGTSLEPHQANTMKRYLVELVSIEKHGEDRGRPLAPRTSPDKC